VTGGKWAEVIVRSEWGVFSVGSAGVMVVVVVVVEVEGVMEKLERDGKVISNVILHLSPLAA
jgi:hypothetical protein